MLMDLSTTESVEKSMREYVAEIINEAPQAMDGKSPTPIANHLFAVNEKDPPLSEAEAQRFHHIVAKLLFLITRSGADIHIAVASLTARVKKPGKDDYKMFTRVIKYLQGNPLLGLILEAIRICKIKWWIDA